MFYSYPMMNWLFYCHIVSCTAFGMCAPFLPIELESKGIPGTWIGLIFACYSIGSLFMSPIIGKQTQNYEAKNLLGGSLGLMGVTFICFGFIDLLENHVTIIFFSLLLRFTQGVFCAITLVSNLEVGNHDFPD